MHATARVDGLSIAVNEPSPARKREMPTTLADLPQQLTGNTGRGSVGPSPVGQVLGWANADGKEYET